MGRLGFRLRTVDLPAVAVFAVLGTALTAWAIGMGWWWQFLLIGWLVGVPLVAILTDSTGDAEAISELQSTVEDADEDAALVAIREQYATGTITESEFERRLERLLETESVEDVRERIQHRDTSPETEPSG